MPRTLSLYRPALDAIRRSGPTLFVENPNTVTGWDMYPHASPGTVNSLEVARPVK